MTREDDPLVKRHTALLAASQLSDRDWAVVELVGKFRQLTARHIGAVLFDGLASQTPLDRTLKRLVEHRYLARLTRLVGGDGGGSAQYVYQLGGQGWKAVGRSGHYWAPRSVNLHTLATADCLVGLKQAEREGGRTVLSFDVEPECHRAVGEVHLTPDAYVELGDPAKRLRYSYWLEVDRGTEHTPKIQDKCVRYWRAYQTWSGEYFPTVVFVVPPLTRRTAELLEVIAAGPDDAGGLFRVVESNRLAQMLSYV